MIKLTVTLLMLFIVLGCSGIGGKPSNGGLTGGMPPQVFIQIGDERHETKLGTYCWSGPNHNLCVDAVGPAELLKNEKPVLVRPGEKIRFVLDYEPLPNKFHVEQISGGNHTEVAVKENAIQAPVQKGIYYYSYGVWWMDEKKENVSHGDAFYCFVLEVI